MTLNTQTNTNKLVSIEPKNISDPWAINAGAAMTANEDGSNDSLTDDFVKQAENTRPSYDIPAGAPMGKQTGESDPLSTAFEKQSLERADLMALGDIATGDIIESGVETPDMRHDLP